MPYKAPQHKPLTAPGIKVHTSREQRYYKSAAWRQLRLLVLHRDPVCIECGRLPSVVADHIKPRSQGGPDSIDNLQGLCRGCHSAKGHTDGTY